MTELLQKALKKKSKGEIVPPSKAKEELEKVMEDGRLLISRKNKIKNTNMERKKKERKIKSIITLPSSQTLSQINQEIESKIKYKTEETNSNIKTEDQENEVKSENSREIKQPRLNSSQLMNSQPREEKNKEMESENKELKDKELIEDDLEKSVEKITDIPKLQLILKTIQEQNEDLFKELTEQEDILLTLNQKASSLIQQVKYYEEAIQELNEDLEIEISNLKQDCEAIEDSIKEKNLENSKLEEQIKEIQEEINLSKKKLENKSPPNVLDQKTKENDPQIIELKKEIETLKTKLSNVSNSLQEVTKTYDEKNKLFTNQKEMLKSIDLSNKELEEQIATRKKEKTLSQGLWNDIRYDSMITGNPGKTIFDYTMENKLNPPHPGSVKCLEIFGEDLWAGCGEGTIRLWNLSNDTFVEDRNEHTECVFDLKNVNDKIWSTSKDKTICVWISSSKKPIRKIQFDKTLWCTKLLQVEENVWCASLDGKIRVWNSNSFKSHTTCSHASQKIIGCLLKRVDRVWVGSDKDIIVWDINRPENFRIVKGHTDLVNDIRNVGPYEVWSCSSDCTIRSWKIETFECLQIINCKSKLTCILEIRKAGQILCGGWSSYMGVYDINTYGQIKLIDVPHRDTVSTLVMDPNTKAFFSGSWDTYICHWKISSK